MANHRTGFLRPFAFAATIRASVGVISEANAHPLNSDQLGPDASPYVVAAVNGDVDNYRELTD